MSWSYNFDTPQHQTYITLEKSACQQNQSQHWPDLPKLVHQKACLYSTDSEIIQATSGDSYTEQEERLLKYIQEIMANADDPSQFSIERLPEHYKQRGQQRNARPYRKVFQKLADLCYIDAKLNGSTSDQPTTFIPVKVRLEPTIFCQAYLHCA